MKYLYLLLSSLLLLTGLNVHSQTIINKKNLLFSNVDSEKQGNSGLVNNTYQFSKYNGTYTELVDAISINNNEIWDDPEYVIPVDIDFELYDQKLDSLYFAVGGGGIISTVVNEDYEADYIIAPFNADILDRGIDVFNSLSPISYKVENIDDTNILILEWKNVGFYDELDSLGTSLSYVNFQVWLYEKSNIIEMHYGPSNIVDPDIVFYYVSGPLIGITDYYLFDAYLLNGNPEAPNLVDTIDFLEGIPNDGTIYRFSPNKTDINSSSMESDISIYPNPSTDIINIRKSHSTSVNYRVTNMKGQYVTHGILNHTNVDIDIRSYPPGIYFLHVDDDVVKFIKE